jgi:hypothetical protein
MESMQGKAWSAWSFFCSDFKLIQIFSEFRSQEKSMICSFGTPALPREASTRTAALGIQRTKKKKLHKELGIHNLQWKQSNAATPQRRNAVNEAPKTT